MDKRIQMTMSTQFYMEYPQREKPWKQSDSTIYLENTQRKSRNKTLSVQSVSTTQSSWRLVSHNYVTAHALMSLFLLPTLYNSSTLSIFYIDTHSRFGLTIPIYSTSILLPSLLLITINRPTRRLNCLTHKSTFRLADSHVVQIVGPTIRPCY